MEDLGLSKILSGIKVDKVNPYATAETESWNEIPLWIPTGNIGLDYAIGGFQRGRRGGVPLGKFVEINGQESTGKSIQLDHIIREVLKVGAFFLCDAEHCHTPERMSLIGCDLTNFLFMEKPRSLEETEEVEVEETNVEEEDASKKGKRGKQAKKPKRTKKVAVASNDVILEEFFYLVEKTTSTFRKEVSDSIPIVFALDSLAAIETEAQAATDDPNMKDKIDTASVMSARLKGMCSFLSQSHASVIIVNQLRTKVGKLMGDPFYSYGGDAKNYYFSWRVRMGSATQIKASEDFGKPEEEWLDSDITGIQCHGQLVKNKVARPWRKFRFPFYFDSRGIWKEESFAQLIVDREKWKFSDDFVREGNTYYWKGEKIGIGEKGMTIAFLKNALLLAEMEQELFM
jgi:RecA/RadA recombinase